MAYKLGDSGLFPEYINYVLGVSGNKITEQTILCLKQLQCTFQQQYVDNTIQICYTRVNGKIVYQPPLEDWSIYAAYYSPENTDATEGLPIIYPTDFIDIYTLPALCGTEILKDNVTKVKQAQTCLSGTNFNVGTLIIPNGIYDEATNVAIANFQRHYGLGQPRVLISEHKNIFPNVTNMWLSGKATGYEVSSHNVILDEDTTCISSYLIPINNNYNYVFDNFSYVADSQYVVTFLFYDKNQSLMDLSANPSYVQYTTNNFFTSGLLPSIINTTTQIAYIQCIVKRYDGTTIDVNDILQCPIQIERGDTTTSFEPNTINNNYLHFSGFLNTVTYNKLKSVYGLSEEL